MKLVGSNLDLRKVSWKKRVDIIPSRLSTDTETSSDEAPHHSHTHTRRPGEDLPIRPADRQPGSQHACYRAPLVRSHARQPGFLSALRDLTPLKNINIVESLSFWASYISPLGPQLALVPSFLPPATQRGALASTAAHPVDDEGQASLCACPSVLSPSRWRGGDLKEASLGSVSRLHYCVSL